MAGQDLRFGRFAVDAERKLLLENGKPVAVGARGVALLEGLLRAEGKPVSKSELMDIAWPGQTVEESNLSVQIAGLRKVLGVNPGGEDWIATIARVGYRFQADTGASKNDAESGRPTDGDMAKPSLAVMAFTNLSSDPEQAFFADGMTEDIIGALSRIGELFVVSRSSSFALKGQAMTPREAAAQLGVRYVLEGSVRPSTKRVRVTAQLTDWRSGATIWADRYESAAEDIFDMQDTITHDIAQALHVTLSMGEAGRLWEGQTKSLRAWEKAILGSQAFHRYSKADADDARRLLEEAVAIDPTFYGAIGFLGIVHYWEARYIMSIERAYAIAQAQACADKMEAADPSLSQLFTLKSCIAFLHGQHDEAIRLGAMSVSRSPSDSRANGFLGMFQMYAGDLLAAQVSMQLASRHSPIRPTYLYYYPALIHMWLGHHDKALELALENSRLQLSEAYTQACLAAVHMFRGETGDAKRAVASLLDTTPAFSCANIRYSELYRDPSQLDRLVAALRAAGLPD